MLLSPVASYAQAVPPPGASPSPAANVKAGHVRLWNMIFLNPTGLELVAGTGPAAKTLQTAPVANYSALYDSLPPGRYMFSVFRAGDRQTPLKSFDVMLADKSYFSILVVHLPGGQLSVELLDDTPDPMKPHVNRLTVRQLGLNTHAMVVTALTQHTDPLEPGSTQTLEGLPDGAVPVSVRNTTGPNQKNWNVEADFRTARHLTVFVVADAYNRLRLRTASNGPSPAEEAEAAKTRR